MSESVDAMKDDLPEWTEKAVLIYGPRKSGTTLLQNLHDGSDELVVYPSEMKLKSFICTVWGNPAEAVRTYFNHSTVIGKNFPNFSSDEYSRYVEKLCSFKINSLREVIQRDLLGVYKNINKKPTSPSFLVVKEVGGPTTSIVSFWRQLFFSGKVIMILRDPTMVTRSVILDRRRKGRKLSVREIYYQTKAPIKVLSEQLGMVNDPGIHFLLYEQLTENPEETMRQICSFIGVKYKESFSYPSIFGEKVITTTSSQKTNKVFKSNKKWHNDLSIVEKTAVFLFSKILMFKLISTKMNRMFVPYHELVAGVRNS